MKPKLKYLALALLALLFISPRFSTALAQGTAFTYQGRLNSGSAPANGSYDLTFTLYTTNVTGSAIVGPVTNNAIGMTNGLFTTLVDFGNAFNGTSNWLEIAVSTNGANSFTTLAPRQQLMPTPYAVFAEGANAAGLTGTIAPANIGNGSISSNLLATGSVGVSQLATNIGVWTQVGTNLFYTNGYVGIGTITPVSQLNVVGTGGASQGLQFDNREIKFRGDGVAHWSIFANRVAGKLTIEDTSANLASGIAGIVAIAVAKTTGYVGIGTNNPGAPLHVLSSGIPAVLMDSSSTIGTWAVLRNTSTGGTNWHIISTGSANGEGPGKLLFISGAAPNNANNTSSLTLQPNGDVGIGTSQATHPLQMGSGAYCSAAGDWTSVSDRNVKEDFTAITPTEVLASVAAMPITQWKYKIEPSGIKHMGPVAQDFHSAFGLGDSDKAIGSVDESGVALAAIQGLNQKLEAGSRSSDVRMRKLEAENAELRQSVMELKELVHTLAGKK